MSYISRNVILKWNFLASYFSYISRENFPSSKKSTLKKFLIYREIEPSCSNIKKFLIFQEKKTLKKFFMFSGNGTL